jgi:hypothetical protein
MHELRAVPFPQRQTRTNLPRRKAGDAKNLGTLRDRNSGGGASNEANVTEPAHVCTLAVVFASYFLGLTAGVEN